MDPMTEMGKLVTRQVVNPCDGAELAYAPGVARELGSMRGDVRLFDNVAPDLSFLSNKIGGLGRAAAGSL